MELNISDFEIRKNLNLRDYQSLAFFFQIAGKFKFKIGEQSFGNNPIEDLSEI